jgi:hypothetical protein
VLSFFSPEKELNKKVRRRSPNPTQDANPNAKIQMSNEIQNSIMPKSRI